jgi:hypothetical protein
MAERTMRGRDEKKKKTTYFWKVSQVRTVDVFARWFVGSEIQNEGTVGKCLCCLVELR